MGRAVMARSRIGWMRWLVPAAAGGTVLAVENLVGFKPPHWSYWISVAFFALLGVFILADPHDIPGMRPAFARAMGVTLLLIALIGVYHQLWGFPGSAGSVR
jgi:hypothetical protein